MGEEAPVTLLRGSPLLLLSRVLSLLFIAIKELLNTGFLPVDSGQAWTAFVKHNIKYGKNCFWNDLF